MTIRTIRSINPATEEVIAEYRESSEAEIEAAVAQAHSAFAKWRDVSFAERAAAMRAAAANLRANKDHYAALMTAEMGKPIVESEAEIEKCAWCCEFFAENAERFLAPQDIASNASNSYVEFDPLGVILAVMPWNFPFWQLFRFAAPSLMAGNTAVLKHASNVSGCALAIQDIFQESGFPAGTLRTILAPGSIAEALIGDPRIKAATLTGSEAAGVSVGSASGRALKKSVLELGGSDPFIVLADADIEAAATTAARARNINSGQSCIAAKRFIVVEDVAPEFEDRFCAAVASLRVGDPMDRATQVGPLARGDLLEALQDQVDRSVKMGAKVALGGRSRDGRGFFYNPTVLTNVTPGMPVMQEETFGPVAAVIRVRDANEAIELANGSTFGLGSSLWTSDLQRARTLARRIEAGAVFINGMVASDPRLPFGGIKRSGYGRELSYYGIREFVNIKTIWVGPAQSPQPAPKTE